MEVSQRMQTFLSGMVGQSSHPQAANMRRVIEDALAIGDRFTAKKAELAADPKLTHVGRVEALKQALVGSFARELRDAGVPIRKAKAQLQTLKNAVKAKPSDPADVSDALLRMEIRIALFNLQPLQRAALLTDPAADPRLAEAVLTAPALLSGVEPSIMGQVEEAYAKAHHGPLIAEIEELGEIVTAAESAISVARGDLQFALEMDERGFEALMTPIDRRVGAPWLLAAGKNGDGSDRFQVVDLDENGLANYRAATPADIADGVFYRDLAEYRASDGVVPQRANISEE